MTISEPFDTATHQELACRGFRRCREAGGSFQWFVGAALQSMGLPKHATDLADSACATQPYRNHVEARDRR